MCIDTLRNIFRFYDFTKIFTKFNTFNPTILSYSNPVLNLEIKSSKKKIKSKKLFPEYQRSFSNGNHLAVKKEW